LFRSQLFSFEEQPGCFDATNRVRRLRGKLA
jgi:hypothetical protein